MVVCLGGISATKRAEDYFSRHSGMGVWRFSAQTEAEAEAVVDWANKAGLDIWLAETAPGFVDVMLPVNSPALE
ncbi:MAG: hypothetical protein Q8P67_07035, partial [archaeon]|nr:hypothetical protein [archaeon]